MYEQECWFDAYKNLQIFAKFLMHQNNIKIYPCSYMCRVHVWKRGVSILPHGVQVRVWRHGGVRGVHGGGHMQRQKRRLRRRIISAVARAPSRVLAASTAASANTSTECLFIGGWCEAWRQWQATAAGVAAARWRGGRRWRAVAVLVASLALQANWRCKKILI